MTKRHIGTCFSSAPTDTLLSNAAVDGMNEKKHTFNRTPNASYIYKEGRGIPHLCIYLYIEKEIVSTNYDKKY